MKRTFVRWFASVPLKSLVPLALSLVAVAWATGTVSLSQSPFRIAGWWPGYVRGNVTCVTTFDNYAYLGMTMAGPGGCERGWRGRLEVMAVSDPARPVYVGGYDFRDPLERIQAASNQVYVVSGQTLSVLAVTNASAPVLSGRCDVGANITSLELKGQYLYAVRGGGPSGLNVIDVSNPAQPVVVGSISEGGNGDFSGVRVVGNRAYVAAEGGLQVFDVSTPDNPTLLAWPRGQSAYAIEVVGDYAYLTTEVDLRIMSITYSTQPRLVGTDALGAGAKALGTLGHHLYVAMGNRLEVLNITNPTQPRRVGGYDAGGTIADLVLAGHYAFVAVGAAGLLQGFHYRYQYGDRA